MYNELKAFDVDMIKYLCNTFTTVATPLRNNIHWTPELKKQIAGIVTDTKGLEEPKDPETCNVFAIYKLVANEEQIETMRTNYLKGGFGYGHAKNALLELILTRFAEARKIYNELMNTFNEGFSKYKR